MSAAAHPTPVDEYLEVVPDLEEIKRLGIDTILAQALGTMYRAKPKHPIDYLGRWLVNHSQTAEYIQSLEQRESLAEQHLHQHLAAKQQKEVEEASAAKIAQSHLEQLEKVRNEIVQAEFHEKLLSELVPIQIYNKIKPSAVYVGMYEFPRREIHEDEDDELAHLQMDSQKVIQYIGEYTRDHEFEAKLGPEEEARKKRSKRFTTAVKGKNLPENAGVTYRLFSKNTPGDDAGGDGAASGPEIFDSLGNIYVADAVMNPDLHYFDIPKLGAYFAVPLVVRSYLNDLSFDDAVVKIKAYNQQVSENKFMLSSRVEELNEKIEMAQASDEEEARRLTQERDELVANWEEVIYPEFESNVLNYVVCIDTLGMDKEISEEDRQFVFEFVEHFKNSWEQKELHFLKTMTELYIENEKTVNNEETLMSLTETEEREYKSRMPEGALDDPTALDAVYREEEGRREIVSEQLRSTQVNKALLDLTEFEYIKHSRVIQNALYLIGYKKKQINIPGTNLLDWRNVRKFFDGSVVQKILDYNFKGPKTETVPSYCQVRTFQERISKIDVREVGLYNFALARLLSFVQLSVSLRVRDVIYRKNLYQEKRKERYRLIQERNRLKRQLMVDLEDARQEFTGEGSFNEEEWMLLNAEKYQVLVPEEPVKDQDLDYDGDSNYEDGQDEDFGDGAGVDDDGQGAAGDDGNY